MAGFVEVLAREDTTMKKPAFHAFDALAAESDVAAGAAMVAAFGGEAVIGGKSDHAGAGELWVGLCVDG